MLVKKEHISFPLIYWILFIPIFLLLSYRNLFINAQIQNYYFNELEDFGRYVFFLAISFAEAFIYIVIIRIVIGLIQSLLKKSNVHS